MTNSKILSLVIFLSFSAIFAKAAIYDEGRKLFEQGLFEEAATSLRKAVKNSPKDALSNFYLGATLLKLGDKSEAVKYLETAEGRGNVDASWELAKYYFEEYLPQDAQVHLEKGEALAAKSKKSVPSDINNLASSVRAMQNMLDRVEKIEIIDTLLVDSVSFINHYRLSPQAGTLAYGRDSKSPKLVFVPEMKNEMLWISENEDGLLSLSAADILDDGTMEHPSVIDLGVSGNISYPFLMADGTTLYYASDSQEDGLGGYDIYFTRRNDDGSYMQSQNLGMPYNSPYNDFMMAIDETTGLGWWASDREQIPGKVTIYIFPPSETRVNYSPDTHELVSFARLDNISATQVDGKDYKSLLNSRLSGIIGPITENGISPKFELDLGENGIYTSLEDFKNPNAKRAMLRFLTTSVEILNLEKRLSGLRNEYSKNKSNLLIDEILNLEGQIESARKEARELRNSAIKLEIK